MRNLNYYIKQTSDATFAELPLSEVDGLILCQIVYLNLEYFVKPTDEVQLVSLFTNENLECLAEPTFSPKKNVKMMKLLRESKRYQEVKLAYVWNQLSYDNEEQFYAVTYKIDDFIFIAFRGTDLTILGWKENFNMAYLREVPAQRDSVLYVNDVHELCKCKMFIGGHSKGGNLALYSAMYSKAELNDDIIKIYNFDGPGFSNYVFLNPEYLDIADRIITMTTQEAVVAVLMYHVDDITFVKAKGFSVLQHEPFNWRVSKIGLFKRVKKNTPQSRWFARAIRHFYEDTTELERKRFVDIMFTIIEVSPDNSVRDIKKHPLKFFSRARRKYKSLNIEELKFFKSITKKIKKSFYLILKQKLKRQI